MGRCFPLLRRSISNSVEGVVRVLLGEAPPMLGEGGMDTTPDPGAVAAIRDVQRIQVGSGLSLVFRV